LCASGLDPTRTNTLLVTHNTVDTPASNVSPQTDDVFLVTATYSPAAGCVDTPLLRDRDSE
jgi:hypothetical protein